MYNVPCLFITYQRMAYAKQALDSLLESDVSEILIWDNNSIDGTREYLNKINKSKIKVIHYHDTNVGIAPAFNWFLHWTKNYDFVAKVDSDTVIPKDFCARMLPHMDKADLVQARHAIIPATCKGGWNQFIKPMRKEGNLCFNSFVGGSGVMMKRKVLSELPHTDWLLYSWRRWQAQNPKVVKAFATNCEITLLDEHGYTDFPEYYKSTKRLI